MKNTNLPISQLPLATALDGMETIPFAKSNANGGLLVSLLTAYIRQGLATQSAVNLKQDALDAGYGIEITADNKIKTTLDVTPFVVVEELPETDILPKIYLVPDPEGEPGKNVYIEYLWIEDHWEELGKFTPAVDLAPYLKTTDAEATYAKKTDLAGLATTTEVDTLSGLVTSLTTLVNTIKEKVDTIPDIPEADGKCYALINGAWSVIADATENIAVINADLPEPTE